MEVDSSIQQPIPYTAMDGKTRVLKYPGSFHNSTSDNWLNLSQNKLCIFPGRLCICMIPGDPKLAIETSHAYLCILNWYHCVYLLIIRAVSVHFQWAIQNKFSQLRYFKGKYVYLEIKSSCIKNFYVSGELYKHIWKNY